MKRCKWCDKEFSSPLSLGGHQTHCKKNPNSEATKKIIGSINRGKILSKETRDKISQSRTSYLIKNPDKIPYKLNHSKEMSWPEREFGRILEINDINGWIYNYSFSIYSLDFAFPEWKLDVEIDGATHLQEKVIIKDQKRDEFVRSQGWKVLRIPASDIKYNPYECVQLLLKFLKIDKKVQVPDEFIKYRLKSERKKEEARLKKIDNMREKKRKELML